MVGIAEGPSGLITALPQDTPHIHAFTRFMNTNVSLRQVLSEALLDRVRVPLGSIGMCDGLYHTQHSFNFGVGNTVYVHMFGVRRLVPIINLPRFLGAGDWFN